jgi:hypothetical protein
MPIYTWDIEALEDARLRLLNTYDPYRQPASVTDANRATVHQLDAALHGHEPIRTVCSWCSTVILDRPEDARGVSHGICPSCLERYRASEPTSRF